MHFQGSDTGSEPASSRGFSSAEPKKEISGTCLAEKALLAFPNTKGSGWEPPGFGRSLRLKSHRASWSE